MSDYDQLNAEIIELRPGVDKEALDDEQRPFKTKGREEWCRNHGRRTELDLTAKRVYCRDCKQEITAFEVLAYWAQDWERMVFARKEARRRTEIAKSTLADLEREERNAKARIRTARKKGDSEAIQLLRRVVAGGNPWRCTEAVQAFLAGLDEEALEPDDAGDAVPAADVG